MGNIGSNYAKNRHNTAWQFASALPFYGELNWQQKFKGEYAVLSFDDFAQKVERNFPNLVTPKNPPDKIYFLKPGTFMNLSGESILALANFFKIEPSEILVCHDELELPIGTFSLKWSGGLAGHNGLRSTKAVLGTPDFWRLRFGIGRPDNPNISVADYVLSRFTPDQQEQMQNVFSQTNLLLVKLLLSKDPKALLQPWSKKNLLA